jgi:hypothetical protein
MSEVNKLGFNLISLYTSTEKIFRDEVTIKKQETQGLNT